MIGLFIGSFNPPTQAHIDICVKLQKKFSKIVMVPVNSKEKKLIDIRHRISMLNILKDKYSFLEVSEIMRDYSFLNYRIVDMLKEKYGNINIIMGSDLLNNFSSFDNYEYLLENYSFTIISRGNMDIEKIIQEKYLKYQDKFTICNYDSNISSTMVRNKIKSHENMESILDNDILNYIEKYHLY